MDIPSLLNRYPKLSCDFSLRGHVTELPSTSDFSVVSHKKGYQGIIDIQACFYDLLRQCDGQHSLRSLLETYAPDSRENVEEAVLSHHFQALVDWYDSPTPEGFLPFQAPQPSTHPIALSYLLLHTTNACNFRCEHCYHNDYVSPNDLALEEIDQLARQVSENNLASMVLSGGEPFLRKDILNIAQILTRYRALFQINTNGFLITDDQLQELAKTTIACMSISLDGPNNEVHTAIRNHPKSFEKILELIPKLDEAQIQIRLTATLGRHWFGHLDSIDTLMDYLNQFTLAEWGFNFPAHTGEAYRKEYDDRFRIPPKEQVAFSRMILDKFQKRQPQNIKYVSIAQTFRWQPGQTETIFPLDYLDYVPGTKNDILCQIHKNLIMMEPDGTVPFCSLFKSRFPMEIGSVRKEPLDAIWEKLCRIRMEYTIPKREFCSSCNLLKYCGGGCPGENPDPSANILTTCDMRAKKTLPYLIDDYEAFFKQQEQHKTKFKSLNLSSADMI